MSGARARPALIYARLYRGGGFDAGDAAGRDQAGFEFWVGWMMEEPADWAQVERALLGVDWEGRAKPLGLGGWGPPGSMEELEAGRWERSGARPFGREALKGLYWAVEWSLELSRAPRDWGEEWSERERGARAWGFLERGLSQVDEALAALSPSGARRVHPHRLTGGEGPMMGAEREAKERGALAEAKLISQAVERRRCDRLAHPGAGGPQDRRGGESGLILLSSDPEGEREAKRGRL